MGERSVTYKPPQWTDACLSNGVKEQVVRRTTPMVLSDLIDLLYLLDPIRGAHAFAGTHASGAYAA